MIEQQCLSTQLHILNSIINSLIEACITSSLTKFYRHDIQFILRRYCAMASVCWLFVEREIEQANKRTNEQTERALRVTYMYVQCSHCKLKNGKVQFDAHILYGSMFIAIFPLEFAWICSRNRKCKEEHGTQAKTQHRPRRMKERKREAGTKTLAM